MTVDANQNMIAHWRARRSAPILDNKSGIIISWTKVYVAPDPFDGQVPYILALIGLDSGHKILCHIIDSAETDIVIGVRVHFVTRILSCHESNSIITHGIKAVVFAR